MIKGYNGNPNLPKAHTQHNWTAEMIQEYMKCKEDPIYFAEKYFRIVHVDKGLITISLYDFQKKAVQIYQNNRKMCLATSRQIGKTTIATVIILHFALFNDNKLIALLANKGDSAREILSRIQMAYEYLPHWLKCGVKEWNKGSVIFDNDSKIIAAASSSSAIRGKSCAMLYIDETAFVDHWDEFSASVLPTLSSGQETKTIFTSTPNGLNHFYDYVDGARKNKNGFALLEVRWDEVPGRDDAWKKEVLSTINNDLEKFEQEYCVGFIGSSSTLISGSTLKLLEHQQPLHQIAGYGYLQYEDPIPGHLYICVVDVSRGKGLDYSAFHIIDTTSVPYKQVATFKNNMITPTDYTAFIFQICKSFNSANVLVEINDIGGQVADLLYFDYGYENIIHTESSGRSGKRVSGGFGKNVDRGVRTTKTVKNVGCSMLKLLVEQRKLQLVDKNTIRELSVFSRKGNSYEAEAGHNDDLVMGLVLFAWLTQDQFFSELNDTNILHHLRDRTDAELMEELSPFGFRFDAAEEMEQPQKVVMDGDVWETNNTVGIW